MTTAAVYLRISQDRTGLELGVDRQREDCRALAAMRGWPEPLEFVDNDISATTGRRRPRYRDLLAAIEAGTVKRVIVWHSSRIWRNRRERADGIELFKSHRVSLVACKGPELDMSTAAGRGMAGLLGEFDTMESEIKAERSAREVLQRAERSVYHGGPRAYGFEPDGVTLRQPEAAKRARWIHEFRVGRSVTSIAREAGKHHSAIVAILRSPKNAGLRILNGVEYAAPSPKLVEPETWRKVVAMLDDPNRRTNTSRTARRWLGSGYYGCERCDGRPVKAARSSEQRAVYRCVPQFGGCGRSWQSLRLDKWVTDLVTARLERGDLADLLPRDRPDLEALRTEATAARRRLKSLASDWAVGTLTDEQIGEATARLRERLGEIEQALTGPGDGALDQILNADDPAAEWRAIPDDQVARRQSVARGLATITLGTPIRGRAKWDAEKFVTVDWVG